MKFDTYIAELLEEHDCVIVPDFGGFVANYAPANVNSINHRFDPPYRKISFNKLLVHNDGLLASYVARKEKEQYEAAVKDLKNYVLYLKEELRDKKKVNIEKVGLLLLQADGSFRFEQIKNPAFFREGFGLESFFSKPVERRPAVMPTIEPKTERKVSVITPLAEKVEEPIKTEPQPKPEAKPEPKIVKLELQVAENEAVTEEKKESKPKNPRRVWPIAVAASIGIPLLGYAVWVALSTPLIKDTASFQFSDLNPFHSHGTAAYEERPSAFQVIAFDESEPFTLEDKVEFLEISVENDPDKTLVVRLVDPKEKLASDTPLRYHIIGGCFSMDENAERMVSTFRNRGTNASIIDRKGPLARVSIASFATKKEAKRALASYQQEISGAWLLYK